MTYTLPQKYTATVADKKNLTEKIVWLRLRTNKPIPYREGQYANFTIGHYQPTPIIRCRQRLSLYRIRH